MRGSELNFWFFLVLLSVMAHSAFAAPSAESVKNLEQTLSGKGVNTDVVLIYRDQELLYESYRRGYTPKMKHLSWSLAKSVSGFLIGQAIEDGKINLNELVAGSIPNWPVPGTRVIDVLQMSSGLDFEEEYSGLPVTSDAVKMLYLEGPKRGMSEFTTALSPRKGVNPGDHFYYSSGDSIILMEILKRKFPAKTEYDSYPNRRFFHPLGITDVTFEQDSRGTFAGSSYLYLTGPDYARIGTLLMNRGVHAGKNLIPKKYFELMLQVAPGVEKKPLAGTSFTRAYSAQITTNLPIAGRGLSPEYADLPPDSILMFGYQGQLVVASPAEKLVIVRLATDKGPAFDRFHFFEAVSELIRSTGKGFTTVRDQNPGKAMNRPPARKENLRKRSFMDYLKTPELIRALGVKEFCSCLRVSGRTDEDCKEDLRQTLPFLPRLSADKDVVSARLFTPRFGPVTRATFRGDSLGCTLTGAVE